jgi:hypothetical protein
LKSTTVKNEFFRINRTKDQALALRAGFFPELFQASQVLNGLSQQGFDIDIAGS